MHPDIRHITPLDRLLSIIDHGLKASTRGTTGASPAGRAMPTADGAGPGPAVGTPASRHSAGLMRVNHAGEVAAQALYHGQALVARDPEVRAFMLAAAREEDDHLKWCAERLRALGSRPSVLDPVWYAGSLALGALAGLGGDAVSLGFITETERQVEGHLDEHLARLPAEDAPSRAVLEQMRSDEIAHGANARSRGAAALPAPIRWLMRLTAKLMTASAYWI